MLGGVFPSVYEVDFIFYRCCDWVGVSIYVVDVLDELLELVRYASGPQGVGDYGHI